MDITPILEIVITIVVITFSSYVLPYLIKRFGIAKIQDAYSIIKLLVESAEQTTTIKEAGKQKKAQVIERLKDYNIKIDESKVSELIESAVLEMNKNLNK